MINQAALKVQSMGYLELILTMKKSERNMKGISTKNTATIIILIRIVILRDLIVNLPFQVEKII
jgi:hypothetical protein